MVIGSPVSISVVIPSHDRPEATLRAVQSVLAQRPLPKEVLVVDDASEHPVNEEMLTALTNNEGEAIVSLIRHTRNLGAAAARNTGVKAAKGDFIAFLDSDDLWCAGKLAAQSIYLDSSEPLLATACGWYELRRGELLPTLRIPVEADEPLRFASGCWFCPGSTLILPRAAFTLVGLFDETLARLEDYEWFLRFAMAGGRLAVAPMGGAVITIGYRYRADLVDSASWTIASKHNQYLPTKVGRAMSSYLAQQCAAAHLVEGTGKGNRQDGKTTVAWVSLGRAVLAAAISLWHSPRLQFHLEDFWVRSTAPPMDPFTVSLLDETTDMALLQKANN